MLRGSKILKTGIKEFAKRFLPVPARTHNAQMYTLFKELDEIKGQQEQLAKRIERLLYRDILASTTVEVSWLNRLKTFESLCSFIEEHDPETIFSIVSGVLIYDSEQYTCSLDAVGGRFRVTNATGPFFENKQRYLIILQRIKRNLSEYKNLYNRLADDISRDVFMHHMRFRIIPIENYLNESYALSAEYSQYFDNDIITFGENEVFVDCGGFDGSTTREFTRLCSDYERIYIYEPSKESIVNCTANLADCSNVLIRNAGVGCEQKSLSFNEKGSRSKFVSNSIDAANSDENVIEIVSLDNDIKHPVTFIKMDIEGFELDAIRGASAHIKNESPKLAICLYHKPSDIWRIPKLINEINPNYNYFLRHYNLIKNWELILYAIPNEAENKRKLSGTLGT